MYILYRYSLLAIPYWLFPAGYSTAIKQSSPMPMLSATRRQLVDPTIPEVISKVSLRNQQSIAKSTRAHGIFVLWTKINVGFLVRICQILYIGLDSERS